MATLEFFDDPALFLTAAGDRLAADPVLSVVVTRVTTRLRDDDAAGVPRRDGVPRWWVVAREGADVVGAAMRTAPFAPYPLYVLPMPEEAARALARELHGRGEAVSSANGALPAVRTFVEETARLTRGSVETSMHMRLFELARLVPPVGVPGALRAATLDEVELVRDWLERFMADADEMAGRPRGLTPRELPSQGDLERWIASGAYRLWTDDGRPVNLTVGSKPAFGVAAVGPVFTPVEARGRGYASAAVSAVSQDLLDQGARVCLFTDQANPTSNRIYQRLGFRPVSDTANMVVRRLDGT